MLFKIITIFLYRFGKDYLASRLGQTVLKILLSTIGVSRIYTTHFQKKSVRGLGI